MTGIIIVLVLLVVGAFYIVRQRIEKQKEFQNTINQGEIATTSVPSDEISDIEKDTNSMNFDNLGTGINNL
jgi:hypothetical protein